MKLMCISNIIYEYGVKLPLKVGKIYENKYEKEDSWSVIPEYSKFNRFVLGRWADINPIQVQKRFDIFREATLQEIRNDSLNKLV